MAEKISPHSEKLRPIFPVRSVGSDWSIVQDVAPRPHWLGRETLHVPKTQRASSDLIAIIRDQTVIKTIRTERTSIRALAGFKSLGFFTTRRFKRVFLTSSLKLVSHFCRRTFLKTQCQAFLNTAQYFFPSVLLKILRKPTKTEMRHRIIKAATQTIS